MNAELSLLQEALEQLEREGRTVSVFFRDDDIDIKEDSLRRMMDVFYLHGVPANLEVVPGCLTEEAVAWLCEQQAEFPLLIELNQHGWMHRNHELAGKKCEFGPSRNFQQQIADLANGKHRMDQAFPGAWNPVFTPPWNRCTSDTYLAIETLGFRVLSKNRGDVPVTAYKFKEISTSIDIFHWKGETRLKEPGEIFMAIRNQCRTDEPIGILLHHKVMSSAALSLLSLLLETLSRYRSVRFHRFQDLLPFHP
jgi:hypothetical protein